MVSDGNVGERRKLSLLPCLTFRPYILSTVPKNLVIFGLAASNFVGGGMVQSYMVLAGTGLAMFVLAGNLGARAWHNLSFSPIKYTGVFSTFIAYIAAAVVGAVVPYMGFREVEIGGQAAIESFLLSALAVALVFIASDIDVVQSFVVMGSEVS
jgi:hypothetical protein